jgi:restriction endonuclease S subunit
VALCSEIALSYSFNYRIRIDAEFYQPRHLEVDAFLSSIETVPLGRVCTKISDGTHFTPNYTPTGVPFLSALNVLENRLYVNGNHRFISEREHRDLYRRCDPRPGDILLRKVGVGPRYAAVVPNGVSEFSIFVSVAQVRLNESAGLRPAYVSTFMNCSYGQRQLLRFNKGIGQPDLHLEDIRLLRVPKATSSVQKEVEDLVASSQRCREQATSLYAKGTAILAATCGYLDPDLSTTRGYETTLSQMALNRRWDGEFYKPKYRRVLASVLRAKKIAPEKLIPIGQVFSFLTNGHTPLRHDLSIGEIPFLTAEHVFDFRINLDTDKRILSGHHTGELARTSIRKGDVLLTIKGKVGNCAVVRKCPEAANINQDVALFRVRNGYHPYFVAAWFNSLVGKQLVEQRSTGGINPFLGLGNLRRMPFPVLDPRDYNRIGDLVQETIERAQDAEEESAALLHTAKRRVEELVEKEAAK